MATAATLTLERFTGDTGEAVTDQILVADAVYDFTGASAPHLRARLWNTTVQVMDVVASWTQITTGEVSYTPVSGDAIATTPGVYQAWWYVPSMPDGGPETFPYFWIIVSDPLGQAQNADLCTLDDARTTLELNEDDESRDALIRLYITTASLALCREADAEFAPISTGLSRVFEVSPWTRRVDFYGYDLQVADTVTLNWDDPANSFVMTAGTDYILRPVNSYTGTYKSLQVSPFDNIYATRWILFSKASIQVTGTWGFPVIPADVRMACIQTVRAWLDRSLAAYGNLSAGKNGSGVVPSPAPSYALPASACALVAPYRRVLV